jgi:hypothetical protein
MNRLQLNRLLKLVCCCLLILGFSFIQVAPNASADSKTILELKDSNGAATVLLDGNKGNIYAGGGGHEGDLLLLDTNGKVSARVDGGGSNLVLGGNDHYGDISLLSKEAAKRVVLEAYDSTIRLFNAAGEETIKIDGNSGDILISGTSFKNLLQRIEALENIK